MVAALFLMMTLFTLNGLTTYVVTQLREKMNVSVYFKENTSEQEIMSAKGQIESLAEVKGVDYVSADQALENFKEKYKSDSLLMDSLSEIGKNPLLATLNVRVFDPRQYASVVNFLEASSFKELIDSVDYSQNKVVIDRLYTLTAEVIRALAITGFIIALIAILITFNAVRMSIEGSKREVAIMRLVGADRGFVMAPLMAEGALIGLLAAVATLVIFSALLFGFNAQVRDFTGGFSLLGYFFGNIGIILPAEILIGAFLGIFSSWLAVRKYLK